MLCIIVSFSYCFFLTDVSGFDVDSVNLVQLLPYDCTGSELLVKTCCFFSPHVHVYGTRDINRT